MYFTNRPTFHCEQCGSRKATITRRYLASATWCATKTCVCNILNFGIAWQFQCTNVIVWEERGLFRLGRFRVATRTRIELLPDEDESPEIRCNECNQRDGVEYDTQILRQDVVEGPDAWTLACHRCAREVPFGWTKPERGGLIVPLQAEWIDVSQLWVDPGFRLRKQIRSKR